MQSLTDLALGYRAIEDPGFAVDPMPHIEAARKAEQGRETHDLLDALIAANAEGRLNDYELRNLLIFLFAAGFDTSKNQLTFIMHVMLRLRISDVASYLWAPLRCKFGILHYA